MKSNEFSIEEVRRLLSYSPETGELAWNVGRGGTARPGKRAGHLNSLGYFRVSIKRRMFLAHRLAWAIHYGVWPSQFIDHINGNRSDNRIANLRDVSSTVNSRNVRDAHADSKSGVLGAYFCKTRRKWCSTITVNSKTVTVGCFESKEQAHEAYMRAKAELHA